MTELRRHERWASVFFTLKDPADGSCVGVTMQRGQFDALRLELADGERVHVYGRPELFEQRGDFRLRALTIERFGVGAHLAALERLKAKLAAEGLFAAERKRAAAAAAAADRARHRQRRRREAGRDHDDPGALPRRATCSSPRRYVQGPRAAPGDRRRAARALRAAGRRRDRAHARRRQLRGPARRSATSGSSAPSPACPVPVVSAVGHEQDTPLCDLAADVRASTPTMAGKLVVPELLELSEQLDRARESLARGVAAHARARRAAALERTAERLRAAPRRVLEREGERVERAHERLRRAPALAVERKRAALESTAGSCGCCHR